MLCGSGQSSRMMFHGIKDAAQVQRVICEGKPATREVLRRKLRSLGVRNTLGQALFMLYSRLLARLSRKRQQELIQRFELNAASIPGSLLQQVSSVNSEEVANTLRELNPDAVIVNGTRIIGTDILTAVPAPFINTHMGITPRYRGVHGGYWALVNDDKENCGVTVHLVDAGIDTGGVLYQQIVKPEPQDNFCTYPLHQLAAALPLMRKTLKDIAAGTQQTGPGVEPSNLWYHPTLWAYLYNRCVKGVR
jgi:methionyl-tRNA formyltransferase